jgi:uncharacterized protein Usg
MLRKPLLIDSRGLFDYFNSQNRRIRSHYADIIEGFEATPDLLAERVYKYSIESAHSNLETAIQPKNLAKAATEFHRQARTLTTELEEECKFIREDSPIIRLAHQPNIFPYLGVSAQFFLMNVTANIVKKRYKKHIVQIYLVVDYDIADESRFRTAYYPDASRKRGLFNLSNRIPPGYLNKPMYKIPKPAEDQVESWLALVKSSVSKELTYLRRNQLDEKKYNALFANLREVEEYVWQAYGRADSFADFNSFFLSELVNSCFSLPVLFVRGSQIHKWFAKTWRFLLENLRKIDDAERFAIERIRSAGIRMKHSKDPAMFPFWYFCDVCDERVRLRHDTNQEVRGRCSGCDREFAFNLTNPSNLLSHSSRLAPTVLLDDISDIVGLSASGGVSYIGGAEHILISNIMAKEIGLRVFPQAVWRPKMISYGISEFSASLRLRGTRASARSGPKELLRELAKGRISTLYYLVNYGVSTVSTSWETFLGRCKNIGEVHSELNLTPLSVSREQVRLLEKDFRMVMSVVPEVPEKQTTS